MKSKSLARVAVPNAWKKKPAPDPERPEPKRDANGFIRCRVCGCTHVDPCPAGCGWAEHDLCTVCNQAAAELTLWRENCRRPNLAGLIREAKRRTEPPAEDPQPRKKGGRRDARH